MLTQENIRSAIAPLQYALKDSGVAVVEDRSPAKDSYLDYAVTCHVAFEPKQLDMLSLDLWLTNDGALAVGVERRSRIAERLGVSIVKPQAFAAGFDPNLRFATRPYLERLLDVVSLGWISFDVLHSFGLAWSCHEQFNDFGRRAMASVDLDAPTLPPNAKYRSSCFRTTLNYSPWIDRSGPSAWV